MLNISQDKKYKALLLAGNKQYTNNVSINKQVNFFRLYNISQYNIN